MTAPKDSMDDRLTLQALREEMVFTRVLLGEQYATSIDAGAATREEITAHILNCGRIAEHLLVTDKVGATEMKNHPHSH